MGFQSAIGRKPQNPRLESVKGKTKAVDPPGTGVFVVGTSGSSRYSGRLSSAPLSSVIMTANARNKQRQAAQQDGSRVHPYHIILMSESDASKALGSAAGELVHLTQTELVKVTPSASRADSSNINPVDIWAWGGQCVPLNYQTAGLVMDLATGFFARNGACGYVLKPVLYRKPSSFFTPIDAPQTEMYQRPPDTVPQVSGCAHR